MKTRLRRPLRWAAALVGAAVAALAVGSPALAAPIIDPTARGSIVVHKFERSNVPTDLPNDGTEQDVDLPVIAGIEFTIRPVTSIDLGTNAGWTAAEALSAAFVACSAAGSINANGHTLGAPVSLTTDAMGEANFTDLAVGLYLVEETGFPSGVTPSAPFLVSVPITDPADHDAWLYDVHVYPKNSLTGITKTVGDASSVALGDPVTWTIDGAIPNEAKLDGYRIVDELDARLTYVDAAVTLVDGTTITDGVDYTLTYTAATNTVTVDFLPAGLLVLAVHNTSEVRVVINTTVNAVGEIANTATLYPNKLSLGWKPGDPGEPPVTPPVVTTWGSVTILKTGAQGAPLAGAVFSVFASEADARAGTDPIELGGATTFPVAADGTLTLSGLRYSDFADGATVGATDPRYRTYNLVEVAAPANYELLAAPIAFTVTAVTSTVGVDLTVKNVPSNGGFELPLTGGAGTALVSTSRVPSSRQVHWSWCSAHVDGREDGMMRGREALGGLPAPVVVPGRRRRRHAARRWPLVRTVCVAVAVLAAAVFAYPATAQWVSAGVHDAKLADYAAEVQTRPAAERQDSLAAARAYNEELPAGPLRDPYTLTSAGEATQTDEGRVRYRSTLAGETGVMATLSIPALDLALPVFRGTDEATLAKGVGHLFGSSLPVGGDGTHAVLTGHSGQPGSELFTHLSDLVLGDVFTVAAEGHVASYRVDTITTVLPEDTAALRAVPGEDHVTLITCTPIGINTHRLLVRGTRVPTTEDGASATEIPLAPQTRRTPWVALSVPVAGALAVLVTRRRRMLPRDADEPASHTRASA